MTKMVRPVIELIGFFSLSWVDRTAAVATLARVWKITFMGDLEWLWVAAYEHSDMRE
jgi:hypothetical protein